MQYRLKDFLSINNVAITSVLLFIIGKIIKSPLVGSILMATSFIMLLTLRNPTENVLSTILMQNTKKEDK